MGVYYGTTEITNVDWIPGDKDITQAFFGGTEVFTVWGEYDGTLPAQYSANGDYLADYRIYGSVGGVGDRTWNAWKTDTTRRGYYNDDGSVVSNSAYIFSEYIFIGTASTISQAFSASAQIAAGFFNQIAFFDENQEFISIERAVQSGIGEKQITVTPPTGALYAVGNLPSAGSNYRISIDTPLPVEYKPYGYEVDMSASDGTTSTTTPIYVGSEPLGEDEYVDYGEGKIYRRTAQLFNKNTVTIGYYISLNGEIQNGNYCCSDFIPISAGSYYLKNVVGISIQNSAVVYDANKRALRYVNVSGSYTAKGAITLTDGDAYIRVNVASSTNIDTIDIIAGSVEPTEHIPYVAPVDPPVPLPQLPTVDGTNIVDYAGQSAAVPSRFTAKYRKEGF